MMDGGRVVAVAVHRWWCGSVWSICLRRNRTCSQRKEKWMFVSPVQATEAPSFHLFKHWESRRVHWESQRVHWKQMKKIVKIQESKENKNLNEK